VSKHSNNHEPSKAELIGFARAVIEILREAGEDWGSDVLGDIASAGIRFGIDLGPQSGDDD